MLFFKALLKPYDAMAEKCKDYDGIEKGKLINKVLLLATPFVLLYSVFALQIFADTANIFRHFFHGAEELTLDDFSLWLFPAALLTSIVISIHLIIDTYIKTKISSLIGGSGKVHCQLLMTLYSTYLILFFSSAGSLLAVILGKISLILSALITIIIFLASIRYKIASISTTQKISGTKSLLVLFSTSILLSTIYISLGYIWSQI